jgi:hypothetical protein
VSFNKLIKVAAIVFIGLCASGWILTWIKPYCTFKTRLNEKRGKWISWVLLGFLAFVLFTVLGVLLETKDIRFLGGYKR